MPQEKTGEVRKSEQVGALQSSLTIALHTRYAIRLWEGRRNNQKEEKQEKRQYAQGYCVCGSGNQRFSQG